MDDKKKKIKDGKVKPSEEEMQAWLDAVHFGSCCSDPLISDEDKKGKEDCAVKQSNQQK